VWGGFLYVTVVGCTLMLSIGSFSQCLFVSLFLLPDFGISLLVDRQSHLLGAFHHKIKVPSIGFVELQRCGLLSIILPEVANLDCVETRNGKSHKNNFYHTLEVLDTVASKSDKLYLRWAALLHDIGKPRSKRWEPAIGWTFHNHNYLGEKMIKPLFNRMKLPLDERMKYVAKLVGLHIGRVYALYSIVSTLQIIFRHFVYTLH
jgi:putative nucleotidyltransferase with HDIG domain